MTSLSTQLSSLQTLQAPPPPLPSSSYASLLLPFSLSSSLSSSSLLQLAHSSLLKLFPKNPTGLSVLLDLLSDRQKDSSVERSSDNSIKLSMDRIPLKRNEMLESESKTLSINLKKALKVLQPYLTQLEGLQILEALIRLYELNRFEAEDLLLSVLPLHSTRTFIRTLQIIRLENLKNWFFLENFAKFGGKGGGKDDGVSREILVKQLVKDEVLFEKVISYAIESENNYLDFCGVLIIEMLRIQRKTSEGKTRTILRFVEKTRENALATSLIVFSSLFSVIQLTSLVVEGYIADLMPQLINNKEKIISFIMFVLQNRAIILPIQFFAVENREIIEKISQKLEFRQIFIQIFKQGLEIILQNPEKNDFIQPHTFPNQDSSSISTQKQEIYGSIKDFCGFLGNLWVNMGNQVRMAGFKEKVSEVFIGFVGEKEVLKVYGGFMRRYLLGVVNEMMERKEREEGKEGNVGNFRKNVRDLFKNELYLEETEEKLTILSELKSPSTSQKLSSLRSLLSLLQNGTSLDISSLLPPLLSSLLHEHHPPLLLLILRILILLPSSTIPSPSSILSSSLLLPSSSLSSSDLHLILLSLRKFIKTQEESLSPDLSTAIFNCLTRLLSLKGTKDQKILLYVTFTEFCRISNETPSHHSDWLLKLSDWQDGLTPFELILEVYAYSPVLSIELLDEYFEEEGFRSKEDAKAFLEFVWKYPRVFYGEEFDKVREIYEKLLKSVHYRVDFSRFVVNDPRPQSIVLLKLVETKNLMEILIESRNGRVNGKILVFMMNSIGSGKELSDLLGVVLLFLLKKEVSAEERKLMLSLIEKMRGELQKGGVEGEIFALPAASFCKKSLVYLMKQIGNKQLELIHNEEKIKNFLGSSVEGLKYLVFLLENLQLIKNEGIKLNLLKMCKNLGKKELISQKILDNIWEEAEKKGKIDLFKTQLEMSLLREKEDLNIRIIDELKRMNTILGEKFGLLLVDFEGFSTLYEKINQKNRMNLCILLSESGLLHLLGGFPLKDDMLIEITTSQKITESLLNLIIMQNPCEIRLIEVLLEKAKSLELEKDLSLVLRTIKTIGNIFIHIVSAKKVVFDFKNGKLRNEDIRSSDLLGKYEKNQYTYIKILREMIDRLIAYNSQENLMINEVLFEIIALLAKFATISYKSVNKELMEMLDKGIEKEENKAILITLTEIIVKQFSSSRTKIRQYMLYYLKLKLTKEEDLSNLQPIFADLIALFTLNEYPQLYLSLALSTQNRSLNEKLTIFKSFTSYLITCQFPKINSDTFFRNLFTLVHITFNVYLQQQKTPLKNSPNIEINSLYLVKHQFKGKKLLSHLFIKLSLRVFLLIFKSNVFKKKLIDSCGQNQEFCFFYFQILEFLSFAETSSLLSSKNQLFNKKTIETIQKMVHFIDFSLPFELLVGLTMKALTMNNELMIKKQALELFRSQFALARKKIVHQNKESLGDLLERLVEDLSLVHKTKKSKNYVEQGLMLCSLLIEKGIEINKGLDLLPLFEVKSDGVKVVLLLIFSQLAVKKQFYSLLLENLDLLFSFYTYLFERLASRKLKQLASTITLLFKSLENMVINLKNALYPYIPQLISDLLSYKTESEWESQNYENDLFLALSNNIPVSQILTAVLSVLPKEVEKAETWKVGRVCVLLGKSAENAESADFEETQKEFFQLLLKLMDFCRKRLGGGRRMEEGEKRKGKGGRREEETEEGRRNEEEEEDGSEQLEEVEKKSIELGVIFCLKCNEVQLKKFLLAMVNWSDKKEESRLGDFPFYRKIYVLEIMKKLSEILENYFVSFYAFIFDFFGLYIAHFVETFSKPIELANKKRKLPFSDDYYDNSSRVMVLLLENFTLLFKHDKEEFIDSMKFDRLAELIPSLLDCIYIKQYTQTLDFESSLFSLLSSLLLALLSLLPDDFKWKTIHYNLLLKSRSEHKATRLAVFQLEEAFIDHFKERFLGLVNDLLPFLSEVLDDLDPEVERVGKSLVVKLEKVSGENVREYLRKM